MAASMLGFDIGSAQLKIACWDGTSVRKMVAVDMPDNMIKNETIISYDAMADFIKATLKQEKIREKRAALILPSQNAFLRRVKVPSMTHEQLMYNLPYEFRDFLNDTKDKYFYDYLIGGTVKGEDGKPDEMDILASSVSKDIIYKYKDMFRRAGLRLEIAVPREVAYINLIRKFDGEENKQYAFIDLGQMSTRLDIFTGTAYETTRIIDLGLKDVDIAIAEKEGVDEHMARAYKAANHNECQESDETRRIYDSIANDLRKAVNFYGFSNRDSDLKDIYLCGGGANIKALVSAIGETLDDMTLHEMSELVKDVKDDDSVQAAFAAAIGATLQNVKSGNENINLVIKEKPKLPVGKTILSVLIVLIAAAAFSKFLVMDRFARADAAESQQRAAQQTNGELNAYLVDYDEIAAKYAKYSVSWMSEQEQARVEKDRILDIIDKHLKNKCTISSISINENTATVQITDCTLKTVSKCVGELSELEEISNVSMKSAEAADSNSRLNNALIVFTMKNAGEIE